MARAPRATAKPALKSAPKRRTPAPNPDAQQSGIDLPFAPRAFRALLHPWYARFARRLPWRNVQDPYATWLSEIMLQQTRVATVLVRYRQFILRFPTITALAEADEADVLAHWSGLGYYRRARMLHRGAQFVQRELNGHLPRTAAQLHTLPGIGDYTAAAIASIAFGESIAAVDGNVERVLNRILGLPEDRSTAAKLHLARVAQALVPPAAKKGSAPNPLHNPPGDHNQAMMELGATICTPRSPQCADCPVFALCKTRGEHATPVRPRQQSRITAHLLTLRKRGTATEVLLERRAANASIMPNMLELPPLSINAVLDREPVLRLRHAITNTNYYVQIYSEHAPDAAPDLDPDHEHDTAVAPTADTPITDPDSELYNADDDLYVAPSTPALPPDSLLLAIPPTAQLEWAPTNRLNSLPLTGLTRKTLQRLHIMTLPKITLS